MAQTRSTRRHMRMLPASELSADLSADLVKPEQLLMYDTRGICTELVRGRLMVR